MVKNEKKLGRGERVSGFKKLTKKGGEVGEE